MKKLFTLLCAGVVQFVFAQNPLLIPDTLNGTTFNLNVQTGTNVFFPPNTTPTYGYNGNFLGPTLFLNKWDSVTMNVTNNLSTSTTVHWHGLHLPAVCDGGPHQIITPGSTWSPVFRVLNDAGTFWYHPHGDMTTELQVTRGLGGLIIIRDSAEAALALPRTYGVDDFPLIVQSKSFDVLYQLAPYTVDDSIMMVNGTIDPFLQVPQQIVRLRLLNATANRVYNFGLNNDSSFYVIGTDGGLLEQPVQLNRIILSPGERVEILVDFSAYAVSQSVNLISYASELPRGYMGADSVGNVQYQIPDYYNNPLNGADFNIVRFDVIAPTSNPVLTVPSALVTLNPWLEAQATVNRDIIITPDSSIVGPVAMVEGPFLMNGSMFDMDSVNEIVYINDIEIWTLINNSMVAHPFHIHDVQFYVLDINGNPPPAVLSGQKDVVTVEPFDTVRFITRFEHFADTSTPFMYHCHLLHHEDEGMMGSFIVVDTNALSASEHPVLSDEINLYPNPASETVILRVPADINCVSVYNSTGELVYSVDSLRKTSIEINVRNWAPGCYIANALTDDGRSCSVRFIISR
jgi:bilirubin oxidase